MTYEFALLLFGISVAICLMGLVAVFWRVKHEREKESAIRAKEKEVLIRRLQETLREQTLRLYRYSSRV